MKNVGILSMHRVVNYGSFLQAYALKEIIEACGECEVSFIDIKPGVSLYKPEKSSGLLRLLRFIKYCVTGTLLQALRCRKFGKQLSYQFNNFYRLLGRIVGPDEGQFDVVVIGSDEVFNCCQKVKWGFSTQLYGDIPNAKNVLSYAASFGATTFDGITAFNLQDAISANIRKLSALSVRDDNSVEILKRITGAAPEKHLDPVLVYGYKKEMAELPEYTSNGKYMVVYSYNGRIADSREITAIVRFAKKHALKIYTVFCTYSWADKTVLPTIPFEVLKVFQSAEYIVSDTFHGTIFSIIAHRNFCTLMRESARNKVTSMLAMLKLEEHIVTNPALLEDTLCRFIDYDAVENILAAERAHSISYLRNNIFGGEE